jgi:hypothetical protein
MRAGRENRLSSPAWNCSKAKAKVAHSDVGSPGSAPGHNPHCAAVSEPEALTARRKAAPAELFF